MVGFMKRFSVTFLEAKRLLNQGILGSIDSFDAYAYSSDFSGISENSKSHSRGGVLRDLGSHVIDLSLWFFGDLEVSSANFESKNGNLSEDVVHAKVEKQGLEGFFDISWCMDNYRLPDFGFTIKGQKGFMKVNDDILELNLDAEEAKKWYKHDLGDNVDFLLGMPEYYREDKHFIDSVLSGKRAEPSFVDGSKVDFVIDEIRSKGGIYGWQK
jgi:predicted dehydrogenase